MDSNRLSRASWLWWLAFAAEGIAAVLETLDGDYLKAVSLYCLTAVFLLLATGAAFKQDRAFRILMFALVAVSIGLFIYRFMVR